MSNVVEHDRCTICTGVRGRDNPDADKWPGHYRGCICRDDPSMANGWACDGEGNLSRVTTPDKAKKRN